MRIPLRVISKDIQEQYSLNRFQNNDAIYIRIKKGMYGFKQAAVLAYKKLVKHLAKYEYHRIPHTVGLWKHKQERLRSVYA